ncbi:phosphotransferase family protein [Streptomyces montanus]|uniref:Phosphotransferase family protein n=1 Tax=Streptomyces montanus TaxID=2580423 RepID=A0A5R9G0K2_9ACTN|nr:phosphotransferase family protein [Streptomyces montanus]TLS47038.1 phosphotransferase family protein [Streptomyces montanus]
MSTATQVPPLAVRVRDRLARRHPGAPIGELKVLPGGHSGLTYSVAAGDARYVVKAVPPGQRPVGRNDVLRQARVLGALTGSAVPVPGVVAVDTTQPAWFAMDFAVGEAVEPVLDESEVPAATARARMLEIASVVRRLHDTDIHTPRLDAPEPLDVTGELERWSRTLHAVPAELRPGGEELLARLARDVPAGRSPVLLHGDFRLGNVLCAGERAVAVVDWEIWSVGDPRIDLGWFLLFTDHRNFPQVGHAVPGLPSEAELLDAYLDGRPPLPAMDWFRALCRLKMAAIMGHNLRRHREGKHHDPDQERLPPTIAAMIRTARDILG